MGIDMRHACSSVSNSGMKPLNIGTLTDWPKWAPSPRFFPRRFGKRKVGPIPNLQQTLPVRHAFDLLVYLLRNVGKEEHAMDEVDDGSRCLLIQVNESVSRIYETDRVGASCIMVSVIQRRMRNAYPRIRGLARLLHRQQVRIPPTDRWQASVLASQSSSGAYISGCRSSRIHRTYIKLLDCFERFIPYLV